MLPTKRMIHTRVWHNNQFTSLKPGVRLFYIGLITLGDDDGRLRGDARYLKSTLFPFDRNIGVPKVEKMLAELAECGLIIFYRAEKGVYVQHPNWDKYQSLRTDRYKPSEYPPPPSTTWQPSDNQLTAQHNRTEVNTTKGNLTEDNNSGIRKNPRELMLEGLKDTEKKSAFLE